MDAIADCARCRARFVEGPSFRGGPTKIREQIERWHGDGHPPVISVEMGGEDVTGRLLAGETVYLVPEQVDPETQQQAGWPEGWTVMGMIDGN